MKKHLGIFLIVILSLILRLIFINKPDGLWNDEYVSWYIASKPFGDGFWQGVASQCHMPLYYLYLKFFMSIFGQGDLLLRLTSVLAGVLSIISMYFVGKEKDKSVGLMCAVFTAISAFLIYYSQEVRFYSLLFLFSSLNLLFTLRIIKNPQKLNFVFYIISTLLILFTHTIGFVYVFFNLVVVSLVLFGKFRKLILSLWGFILFGILICSPLVLKILTSQTISQWWGHFSVSKIGFLFTDYFSPVITNLTNAPDNFFYLPKLLFYMLVPTLIAIFGVVKAMVRNKINIYLFLLSLAVTLVLIVASLMGKLVFITKYSIEIYPILIYLACFGLKEIKITCIRNMLLVFYCIISLGYILLHPYSAPKMRRAEGHKLVMDMLKRADLKPQDIIILQYYPKERFEKYFDFSNYKVISMNKSNSMNFIDAGFRYDKKVYKDIFMSDNNYFSGIMDNAVLNDLKIGQSVAMVILNSVSFLSPDDIFDIVNDDEKYEKEPIFFLVFSYLKKETFIYLTKHLPLMRVEQKGNWTVVKFTKINI